MKFKWKREKKQTGLRAIGSSNNLRPWYMYVDNNWAGDVFNVSQHALSDDSSGNWKVSIHAIGRNIIFKQTFTENQVEEAKAWAEQIYEKIMKNEDGKYTEFKNRIIGKMEVSNGN